MMRPFMMMVIVGTALQWTQAGVLASKAPAHNSGRPVSSTTVVHDTLRVVSNRNITVTDTEFSIASPGSSVSAAASYPPWWSTSASSNIPWSSFTQPPSHVSSNKSSSKIPRTSLTKSPSDLPFPSNLPRSTQRTFSSSNTPRSHLNKPSSDARHLSNPSRSIHGTSSSNNTPYSGPTDSPSGLSSRFSLSWSTQGTPSFSTSEGPLASSPTTEQDWTDRIVNGSQVVLTPHFLSLCVNNNWTLTMVNHHKVLNITYQQTTASGQHTVASMTHGSHTTATNGTQGHNSSKACWLKILPPTQKSFFWWVKHLDQTCVHGNDITARCENSCGGRTWKWTGCPKQYVFQYAFDFLIRKHPGYLLFGLHVFSRHVPYSFSLSVLNLFSFPRDTYHPHFLSSSMGYLQTWLWDASTVDVDYCYLSDDTLRVPSHHHVMLSPVYTQNVRYNKVNVHVTVQTRNGDVLYFSLSNAGPPQIFDASSVCFQTFYSKIIDRICYGFRFFFTFHKVPSLPQSLGEGQWNCSVPYWSSFQPHVHCNLVKECEGGEDETECGYQTCGQDGFLFHNHCYIMIQPLVNVTFPDVIHTCRKVGGRLPTFSSVVIFNALSKFLWKRSLLSVFLGVTSTLSELPRIYHEKYQWLDTTITYNAIRKQKVQHCPCCGMLVYPHRQVLMHSCKTPDMARILCQLQSNNRVWPGDDHNNASTVRRKTSQHYFKMNSSSSRLPVQTSRNLEDDKSIVLHTGRSNNITGNLSSLRRTYADADVIPCKRGYVTHSFLACDVNSACWSESDVTYVSNAYGWDVPSGSSCTAPMTSLPPGFACAHGLKRVSYSLVCDHQEDCFDGSDEHFCHFYPPCDVMDMQCGTSKQCFKTTERCDGQPQCVNEADEYMCANKNQLTDNSLAIRGPPVIIDLSKENVFIYKPVDQTHQDPVCPESHFQCAVNGYCLPMAMLCNAVNDCPGHEDERDCEDNHQRCQGFFKCRSSTVCLHPSAVCDGIFHCPHRDDEALCRQASCPDLCTCVGLAFFCSLPFNLSDYGQLRYLHAAGSGLTLSDVIHNKMLIHLGLHKCGLHQFIDVSLPNLHSLDVSGNSLRHISLWQLKNLTHLMILSLNGNPLSEIFTDYDTETIENFRLQSLDLSKIKIHHLDMDILAAFPKLQTLNLSECQTERISRQRPDLLRHLQLLDMRGSPVHFLPRNLFQGLDQLGQVSADNYKLCCPAVLPPGFNPDHCFAPFNQVSSCESLLRSSVYRIFLSLFACLALVGNVGSFGMRMALDKTTRKSSFTVFVIHLCVADFIMGVYLAIIGVADHLFQRVYLWEDTAWRQGTTCKLAGFLCLLSSEVSALIICLITLDRFLVLRFPFSSMHFSARSSQLVCCWVWLGGLALSTCPVLPVTSHWHFYGQTGTCLPLPITDRDFPGYPYSFGVMIVFNFVLFVLIVLGQIIIYTSVRSSAVSATDCTRKAREISIARRLVTIVVTDFLCWFPVGVLGLLSAGGSTSIPSEVSVAMAICVLPLNSAINPFLYTLNTLLEKRRVSREAQLLQQLHQLKAQQHTDGTN